MCDTMRKAASGDLDRLEVLLCEQDRLVKLTKQYLRNGSEADPWMQVARLRLEIFHGIAVELRERINLLREEFLEAELGLVVKAYVN
jgi:hypothetical protein